MDSVKVFWAPLMVRVQALIFLLGCLFVGMMVWRGLLIAEGGERLLLWATLWFPVLMTAVAVLRLLAVFSRRVELGAHRLHHRQVFKDYDVPLDQIRSLDLKQDSEGEISALRVVWSGTPFYMDARGVADFEALVAALRACLPGSIVHLVEVFEPTGST